MNNICIDSKKVVLEITNNCLITANDNINEYLEINLSDGVEVTINSTSKITKNRTIVINQTNKSKCYLNLAGKNIENNKIVIINNINGDDNETKINVHLSLYENNETMVTLNVNKKTINNIISENIRILNLSNKIAKVLPIMNVDTNNVVANHACTISNIDENYLFYLNSHNISTEYGINMLEESFLKSIFNQ